jgi:hypothetical protein
MLKLFFGLCPMLGAFEGVRQQKMRLVIALNRLAVNMLQ